MNLKINHRAGKTPVANVKYFNNFSLNLKFDSVADTFGFEFYFDPKNKEHAEMACVSHFHEATVEHNEETLVTGFILSQNFKASAKKELASVGGYSKPGVLEDSSISPEMFPLQADGLNLIQITQKLIKPFKIKLIVDPAVQSRASKVIPKTTASATSSIKDYLTELATQRNIIITHNEKGDLLFTEAKTNQPPLFHIDSGIPGTEMEVNFNGQGIHSHITVMKQASSKGGNAAEHTIKNPYCPVAYVKRYKTIIQSSGDDNTISQAAKQALAEELKNITLTITTDRWEVDGKILRPNNIITVKNPEIFLYKKTTWFIESINYTGDEKKMVAVLTCVLPEVYNGKTPKNVFVDVHENLPRF
jgi:prophage tail gpP-like protein